MRCHGVLKTEEKIHNNKVVLLFKLEKIHIKL